MIIKEFEPAYRDDLIFMILQAKDALGRKPGLNEDLLDIQKNYFKKGDELRKLSRDEIATQRIQNFIEELR